jgi:hypothetical protein
MATQTVGYPYNEILFRNKNEGTVDVQSWMDLKGIIAQLKSHV